LILCGGSNNNTFAALISAPSHPTQHTAKRRQHQSGLAGRREQGLSFDHLILLRTKLAAQAGPLWLKEEARNTNETKAYSAGLPGLAVFMQV